MATKTLVASTYSVSNSTVTVSNPANMYTDVDSTTYATITHTTSGTTSYYCYIKDFDFDEIPSNAEVSSIVIRIKGRSSGLSTSTTYAPRLYNNTSTITGASTASTNFGTGSAGTTVTVPYTGTWDTLKGYGSNLGIRVTIRRSARNTQGYLYVYGAEIEVTYTVPNPRTITTTLTGNGTISPSGSTTAYDGDEFELVITPTTKTDSVTVTNNGNDVTEELEPHYASGTSSTITKTATGFTTELSASGANFYTGSNTTGNYFNYAVGHTAASPGSTSTSYNTYVKDNGNNTATGWAWYTFDFSDIPANAQITDVTVQCYGATENTAHDATHKANITLYSGTEVKSVEQYFTSTSNSTITISEPGEWTREDLQDARLKFEVAYYGGRLFGITWTVTYMVGTTPDYYTYIYEINGDATIAVVIGSGSETRTFWDKSTGTWTALSVTKVWKKNSSGVWVEQADWTTVFDANTNYVKG